MALKLRSYCLHHGGMGLIVMPWLGDRAEVSDAAELMARFGDRAGPEAAARADACRDRGNHLNFCRWRQIERLILMLSADRPFGTIH